MTDFVSNEIAAALRRQPLAFHFFRALTIRGRKWYWHLKARNGEIVAASEGYANFDDARAATQIIRNYAEDADEIVHP